MILANFFRGLFNKQNGGDCAPGLAQEETKLNTISRLRSLQTIKQQTEYMVRVWDGQNLIGWKPGSGKLFLEYPAHMLSTFVYNGLEWVQVFDGDLVSVDGEVYYVNRDEAYLDYPEGSEFLTHSVVGKQGTYALSDFLPGLKVIGNIFQGEHRISVKKYLRKYKEEIIRTIMIPVSGIPSLSDCDPEETDTLEVKIEKRKRKNEKLDRFQVSSVPEFFARSLDEDGLLNIGLCCPFCGTTPIIKDPNWAFQWEWKNGVKLNICAQCSAAKSRG